jgi:hypothetical protein
VLLTVFTLAFEALGFHYGVQPDEKDPNRLADAKIATRACFGVTVAGVLGSVVSARCACLTFRYRH